MAVSAGESAATYLADIDFARGGIDVEYILGTVLKTIAKDAHNNYAFTYQGAGGAAGTITISSTSHFHVGAVAPANTLGVDDDVYLDTVTGAFYQKSAGTWGAAVYTFGAGGGGGGSGFTLRHGSGVPAASLGEDADWYVRTDTGQWYQKHASAWHVRFTPVAATEGAAGVVAGANNAQAQASHRDDHPGLGSQPAGDVPDHPPADAEQHAGRRHE